MFEHLTVWPTCWPDLGPDLGPDFGRCFDHFPIFISFAQLKLECSSASEIHNATCYLE